MKTSVSKPLLRLATAHTAVGNRPGQQSSPRSSIPLLSSRTSPSSSPVPETYATTTPTTITPLTNLQFLQRSMSTARTFTPPVRFNGKLGTLALLGGVMLFLGASPTTQSFFPFSKPTPASRMKERLEKHGFVEKIVVPDGNCQMRSISDQILGDENNHKDVRSRIVNWLNVNEKYAVDDEGSTTLGDFIDRDQFPRWGTYTAYMARNGAWGDHITLVAAAEVYGVNIDIISNVDDRGTGQYMTSIHPRHLSHWHEMHYNSLHPVNQLRTQAT